MQRAIAQYGKPGIVNTDQGCQFSSAEFTRPSLVASKTSYFPTKISKLVLGA